MGTCTVVVTGASGSCYGMRLIEQLVLAGHDVTVVFTDAGREVTAFELGFELPIEDATVAAGRARDVPGAAVDAEQLRVAYPDDLLRRDCVRVASHRRDDRRAVLDGVCWPRSRTALADDLPERAADVMLKERRPLVLVPRETPLSLDPPAQPDRCGRGGRHHRPGDAGVLQQARVNRRPCRTSSSARCSTCLTSTTICSSAGATERKSR